MTKPTTKAAFKKGQLVTDLSDWDRKGTVGYRHAVVHSCGKKQMVLTCATTGEELGHHFAPVVAQLGDLGVYPRMTDEEAIAACLAAGANVLVRERAHYADRRVRYADASPGYHRALDESEAALHEPRAVSTIAEHERFRAEAEARHGRR